MKNKYRYIEPEVAGGFGTQTILNSKVHPPIVERLNYEFDGWLEDEILESFPCYIVTKRLKNRIEEEGLTGIEFDDVLITKSQFFIEMHPDMELPEFYWAKIIGKLYLDDFAIGTDLRLMLSENAYLLLSEFNVKHAIFENLEF